MSLETHSYCSLRTFRKSGVPVDTPVWFATSDAAHHYIFSAGEAGKIKRLRHNHRAQIASCDLRGGSLGEWREARAFLVDNQEEIALAYRLLTRKYGWQMRMTNFFSRLSGKINKRQIIRVEVVNAS